MDTINVQRLEKLRELLKKHCDEVVDDPEEIYCEIACNATEFVEAIDAVLENMCGV